MRTETEMTKRAEMSFTKPGRTNRSKVAPRKLITVEFDDMDQSYKLPEKLEQDKTPPIPTSPVVRSNESEEIKTPKEKIELDSTGKIGKLMPSLTSTQSPEKT